MSTEIKLEQILERVERGLTTYHDSDWLRWYFSTLKEAIEELMPEKKKQHTVLVDPDWRFGGSEDYE